MALPLHTKAMQFTFTNKIVDTVCLRVTIPHTMRNRATYSKRYRILKGAVAESEGIALSAIKGKSEFITAKNHDELIASKYHGRIVYEWPGGVLLSMPDDADEYDYKIVLAQLDVLKMKFERPNQQKTTV